MPKLSTSQRWAHQRSIMGHPLVILLFCLTLFSNAGLAQDERTYLDRVTLLEAELEQQSMEAGPFGAQLFEPLMELARLHLSQGDHERATESLRQAQNIVHRQEGVYTPRQQEIIQLLISMAMSDGDFETANQQQKFNFFVTTHHLDDADPNLLSAYSEMADWYMQTGQTQRARRLLQEAFTLAEELGADPLPIAIQLNKARRLEGLCCNPRQLIATIEQQDRTDPDSLAQAYMEIADTLIMGRKEEEAAAYFARAESISPLSTSVAPRMIGMRRSVDNLRVVRVKAYKPTQTLLERSRLERMTPEEQLADLTLEPQWFIVDAGDEHLGFTMPDTRDRTQAETERLVGHPIMFSESQLDNLLSNRLASKKEELTILVSFTVGANGNLDDIEVIESTAPAKLERLLVNALKKIYFRPALEDGVPVTTKDVRLLQTFAGPTEEV